MLRRFESQTPAAPSFDIARTGGHVGKQAIFVDLTLCARDRVIFMSSRSRP